MCIEILEGPSNSVGSRVILARALSTLYNNDRSEIIWTDADVTHIKRTCSAEVANAVDLACHTGLRLSDLIRVAWSHVGDDAIVLTTGKSSHRREAIIPLHSALRDVLGRIPKLATTILTSSRRRPWTADVFRKLLQQGQDRCQHVGARSTLAWEEDWVEKIIGRYVAARLPSKRESRNWRSENEQSRQNRLANFG